MSNTVTIRILGDSRDAQKAFNELDTASSGFASKMESVGRKMSSIGTGMTAAITLPVVGIGALWYKEFSEAEKVMAQTEAVIKSTGGAAGVTSDDVANMAGTLLNLSGVDDEVIQSGENMLLTFTNIKNGVGEGNDVFNQATQASLDMSVALGEDMTSAAMRVGKALNDPVGGVTALRRVGVQLTDSQEALIKKMVESGDVMGAQKVILGELNTEFGGSAKAAGDTLPGQIDKLKNKFLNMGSDLVASFIPTIEKVTDFFGKLIDKFQSLTPEQQDFIVKALLAAAALGPVLLVLGKLIEGFKIMSTVIGAVASPIGLIIAAVVALAVGLWWLYNNNEQFRTKVQEIWNWIKDHVTTVVTAIVAWFQENWPKIKQIAMEAWEWIKQNVIPKIQEIIAWVQENWPKLQEAIGHVMNVIKGVIEAVLVFITYIWQNYGTQIWSVVTAIWDSIKAVIGAAINIIKNIIELVLNVINGDWGQAWQNIKNIVGQVWNAIFQVISSVIQIIWATIQSAMTMIGATISNAWNYIYGIISAVLGGIWGFIVNTWNNIIGFISGIGGRIAATASGMWDGISNAFRGAIQTVKNIWNAFVGFWNGIQVRVPSIDIPLVGTVGGFTVGLPDLPYLAQGANVLGAGLAVVGDAGPEILSLPAGAQVTPLGGGSGSLEEVLRKLLSEMSTQSAPSQIIVNAETNADPFAISSELAWVMRTSGR